MSFAGFVFDMIRRDKENRSLRNLRRERLNSRLDKMHKGHGSMPSNTTVEELKKIQQQTAKKEKAELKYSTRMTLIILEVCILTASLLVLIFIK